jgi:hypothetical protein
MTEALTFEQLSKQGVDVNIIDTDGLIVENRDAAQTRWSDLFRGEETTNAAQLDLDKVQMFYFTVILLVVYGVTLGSGLAQGQVITSFPKLSEGMVALLGISHAGYLTHKTLPHTTTP